MKKQLKINEEFKDKWLKELRSDKYKQGTGELCNVDTEYCCLGIACVVAGIPPVEHYDCNCDCEFDDCECETLQNYTFNGEDILLPHEVCKLMGIEETNPYIFPDETDDAFLSSFKSIALLKKASDDGHITLSVINDAEIPFTKIADLIEKYL